MSRTESERCGWSSPVAEPGGTTPTDRLGRSLLLAPLVFIAHVTEESPGFVPWFNAHASPDITWGLFWTGNLAGFVITLVVVATYLMSRSTAAALAALAWVGFLMLSNGVFHLAGALLDRSYVPGLVTAVLLYLPYSAWVGRRVVRDGAAPLAPAVVAAVLGALPMVIHGYLILFRGARLI